MHGDLPRYRSYHAAIAEEIKRRSLGIKLLATDASPVEYWGTIAWASQNMDDAQARDGKVSETAVGETIAPDRGTPKKGRTGGFRSR